MQYEGTSVLSVLISSVNSALRIPGRRDRRGKPQQARPFIVIKRQEQMRFLTYGRVVDTARMREVLGFTPRYDTRRAFDDFVARQGLRGPLSPDTVSAVERTVTDLLARAARA